MTDTLDNTQSGNARDIGKTASHAVKGLGYSVKAAQGDYEGIGTDAAKDVTMSALESNKAKDFAKDAFAFAAKYVPKVSAFVDKTGLDWVPAIAIGAKALEGGVKVAEKVMNDSGWQAATVTAVSEGAQALAKGAKFGKIASKLGFSEDIVAESIRGGAQYAFGDTHPEWVPDGSGTVATIKGAASLVAYKPDEAQPHESPYERCPSFASAYLGNSVEGADNISDNFGSCAAGNNIPAPRPGMAPSAPVVTASIPQQPQQSFGGFGPSAPRPSPPSGARYG